MSVVFSIPSLASAATLILSLAACRNGSDSGGAIGEVGPEARETVAEDLRPETLGADSARQPVWADGRMVEISEPEGRSLQLETAAVERRALASRLRAMGQVLADPYRRAIVSYPFPARVSRIDARIGEWVDPGQELLVLQSEEVGEATSAFYRARADHALARANFERESQLLENGVGARKNHTLAESELRVAEANLEAAEKKLHVMGFTEEDIRRLGETHQILPTIALHAPIAGKVVTSNAVLGGMIDQGTEILTILDPTRVWVEAAVYEKDIARVKVGQRAQVSVAAYPDEAFQGIIAYVGDLLDPETRTVTARTEVPNPQMKLKPGMFAELTIELAQNGGALAVPDEAVLQDQEWSMVFVWKDSLRFEPRLVVLGTRGGGFVEVARGLQAGERVVTRGNFQLKSKLNEALLHAAHIH
jgi:cobalt-zinc-cadmium efflux system membrane fusion protein